MAQHQVLAFRRARRAWLRVVAMLLALVLGPAIAAQPLTTLTADEQAWIQAHPTIRVGVSTEFPPYYFSSERGRYEGFVIDLMGRLGAHLGVGIEYVRFERFGDVLEALKQGKVDATPFTSETPDRRGYLRFVRPLFTTQMVYVADRRLGDISFDPQFSGYRVAVEQLSTAADLMRERFPGARVIEYPTGEQALLATAAGDADIFLGFRQVAVYFMEKHLTANLALRGTIATPGTALGPAVRADLPELASALDKAINELTIDEIGDIASRWLPRSVLGLQPRPELQLTDAQRAWIKEHGHLRLGFDASFAPIAFTNMAGGFDGLAADITRALAQKSGLIISYEQGGSFEDVFERAQKGELDVIVAAARNTERSLQFDFVGPFLRVPTVIVAATDHGLDEGLDLPGTHRLALLKSHFLIPQLRSRYPNLTLVTYGSQAEVLDAVRHGDADLAIGNMKVVDQLIDARHSGALRVIGVVPQGDSELYFAVRKSLPELAVVIRAALDAMTPAELTAMEGRWLRVQYTAGLPWGRVVAVAAVGLLLATLVVGSLWYSNRRLRLAHTELEHARRLADEQVALRASFIAYLSHELRGALGGIASALDLIVSHRESALDRRELSLLSASRDSASGLFEFCERTLDFERMLEGGVDLQPTTVSLADVIGRAVAPWRVQAELKGLAFRATLPEASSRAVCDPVRLTQIIQNLVGNAVKFTVTGSVDVDARIDEAQDGARTLWLKVEDTGPGITDADRERLFRPFAQGEAGKAKRRGAGLGLAIASRIAQAFGGTIELAATSASGSRFELRIPIPRVAEPALATASATTPAETEPIRPS